METGAERESTVPTPSSSYAAVLSLRESLIPRQVGLSYSSSVYGPLLVSRGEGSALFDGEGRRYIDCVNNVAHVGHSHPTLLAALQQQMQRINTNTVTAAAAAPTLPPHPDPPLSSSERCVAVLWCCSVT